MNLVMGKNNEILQIRELEKIKKLHVLQLSQSKIPILDIAKAAGMSPNEIYKFMPKKGTKKSSSK